MDDNMTTKYRNSPIVEVVCEFHFQPNSNWDQTIPGLIYDRIGSTFPKRKQVKAINAEIRGDAADLQQQVTTIDRLQLFREDEKALVQISPHFLAVNHLKPYPTWEEFLPIVEMAFSTYRAVADPKGLHRIGLQYINHIEFAETVIELEYFFNFYPFIGPELPQDHGPFIAGVNYLLEGGRDILLLQMNSGAAIEASKPGILLTLNYFLAKLGQVPLDDAMGWLEQAHSHIGATFEGCLKESLRARLRGEEG